MAKQKNKAHNTTLDEEEGKNPLEWTVFAVSLLLVLGIVGFLVYKTYTYIPNPPDLQVEYAHEPSEHAPNRFRVVVINNGNETAEEVKVQVVLQKAGQELEKAELQLPFSPRGSRRKGWVIFTTDPATADTIVANVVSYRAP